MFICARRGRCGQTDRAAFSLIRTAFGRTFTGSPFPFVVPSPFPVPPSPLHTFPLSRFPFPAV